MKTKIPTALMRSSLQAAAALHSAALFQDQAHSTVAAVVAVADDSRVGDAALALIELPGADLRVNNVVNVTLPVEWDNAAEQRFRFLAEKEALGSADPAELYELEMLSSVRRTEQMPRTGEEFVREYEQGQLIRNLLNSLTRYVQFEQSHSGGTRKARARASAQT